MTEPDFDGNMRGLFGWSPHSLAKLVLKLEAKIRHLEVAIQIVQDVQCDFEQWWYSEGIKQNFDTAIAAAQQEPSDPRPG